MIPTTLRVYTFLLFLIIIIGCSKDDDENSIEEGVTLPTEQGLIYTPESTLKNSASFPVGNVVSANKLQNNNQFKSVLINDFNSITAENDMKMANIFTGPNSYDFSDGDLIVEFAKNNGFRVFGHALIWHNSIPNWLQNYQGSNTDFEVLIKNYIQACVAHFSTEKTTRNGIEVSVVAGWDVVNEAFTDEAESAIFRQRMGADYVAKCFQWAREADSEVKLFYNDYNLERVPSKTEQVVAMVNDFRTRNIPIDGVGFQMHIDYQSPSITSIENNLKSITDLGVLVHFSEIDMTVNRNKALTSLTYERAMAQENRFQDIAAIYSSIDSSQQFGMTFWGLRDVDSWLLNFYDNPNEYPLLFDENYNFKIAHRGFIAGLQ